MTHVYSVKRIQSLIRDLESSSVNDNNTAFGRLVIFFATKSAWASLPAETQNDLKQQILGFLKEPPTEGPDGTFTIRNLPLRLVLKTAEMVPDRDVIDRLDQLRQTGNERVRQAVVDILGTGATKDAKEDKYLEEQRERSMEEQERLEEVRVRSEEDSRSKSHLDGSPAEESIHFMGSGGPGSLADMLAARGEEPKKGAGNGAQGVGSAGPPPERTQKLFLKSMNVPASQKAMGSSSPGDTGSEPEISVRTSEPCASPPVTPLQEKKQAGTVSPPEVPRRLVNTGFVPAASPNNPVQKTVPLKTSTKYYFIFNIGKREAWSGEQDLASVFPPVPENTEIQVALFSPDNGIIIPESGDIGELVISGDGADVVRQPGMNINDVPVTFHGSEWLFFPFTTPAREDLYEMHCIIYAKQVPIQVRRITVQVTSNPEDWPPTEHAWGSDLIFSLSASLIPAVINQIQEHRASIFFDINTKDTCRLFIFGSEPGKLFFKEDICFEAERLQALITGGRERLKKATFRTDKDGKIEYIYKDRKTSQKVFPTGLEDLISWGHEFYYAVMTRVPAEKQGALSRLLQGSAYIQVAMKDGTQNFFPAAMIYDFPFETGLKKYRMCPRFWNYLADETDLSTIDCYGDQCVARNDDTKITLCPMGFWGFRHILGIPLSVKNDSPASRIPVTGDLNVVIATAESLDTGNVHFNEMTKRIKTTSPDRFPNVIVNAKPAANPVELKGLLNQSPHIVYFFCHGITNTGGIPVLECGPGSKPFQIPPSYFDGITSWGAVHPLVFINGCHTGDVKPEEFLEFITPLIVQGKAAGVVGTEIQIYDAMAACFADSCLSSFVGGKTIGEAVRDGRLAVLSTYNPLGLVYNPFISGGVKLEKI
jgi:hypothetical protein